MLSNEEIAGTKWAILFGGFELDEIDETVTLLGPFASKQAAEQFAKTNFADQDTHIVPITEPITRPTDNKYLVIALTDRRSVQIRNEADWPIIAEAHDHNGTAGNGRVDASREWQMTIRQNRNDGRMIVYGVSKPGQQAGDGRTVKAGYLIGPSDDMAKKLTLVSEQIRCGSDVARACLQDMPPEELGDESASGSQQNAYELLDDAFMAVHNSIGNDAQTITTLANRNNRMFAMIEMMAAMTGRTPEAIYQEFRDRLQDRVESGIDATQE